jgi:hypothetical protein
MSSCLGEKGRASRYRLTLLLPSPPTVQYQNIIDRSGVWKKSLSSYSGHVMSVDTNATIAEKDKNVIESVQDGKNELLRYVSSSTTNSMKETTVSHLNKCRQNIVVDGKLYR